MKIAILLIGICTTLSAFAQPGDKEVAEVWNTHVKAIRDMDLDGIKAQCDEYVGGDWGYVVGLESDVSEWTVEEFVQNAEFIFTEELREELKYGDPSMLELRESDTGWELILAMYSSEEVEGEMYEFATVLMYILVEGEWKLSSVFFAG